MTKVYEDEDAHYRAYQDELSGEANRIRSEERARHDEEGKRALWEQQEILPRNFYRSDARNRVLGEF